MCMGEGRHLRLLLAASRLIDRLNERIGRTVYWMVLAAVLVSSANAVVRYVFDYSSNAWLELQWYLFMQLLHDWRGLHLAQERARPDRYHL